MSASPDSWTHHRARVASLTARGAPVTEIDSARRDLRVARLADYIRTAVDAAPPLTDAQRGRLAALLRSSGDAT